MTTAITSAIGAKESLQAAEILANESTNCAAILPYWPIWAAAQFASDDESKQLLCFVHVYRNGDILQIESTDGRRAFRYQLPAYNSDKMPTLWRFPESGILLHAKPLKKAVNYAKLLTVTNDMRAVFHGGKKDELLEISSVNLAGHYTVYTVSDCAKVGTYPNINQLWPEDFTNQPKKIFAFNARYLREWCSVVEKLSDNSVTRCMCNSPITPFVWRANYEPRIGEHFEDAKIEYLICPVQVRD